MTRPDDTIRVVDLFCGAGGFSTGAALALEELGHTPGEDVELHAINHWDVAVETHEQNHPWAEHYHSDIDDVDPLTIADPGSVELMVGGPECTHYSTARGGKPVSDQKREPAFNVLTWVQKLRPANVLIENVEEFRKWGPIDDDGQPSKDGTVFDAWVTALNALGYAVDHQVLNAADYGDPTSRKRLFIIARRQDRPTFPAPTHSDDPEDGLADWRTAAEVIDWSDPGTSLWTRDLEEPRVQPLSVNTMARIAEGIRRHCDDRLAPFADALEGIGPDELRRLRECVVPAAYAQTVADAVNTPFLVEIPGRRTVEWTSYLLGQHSTNQARGTDRPAPTVTRVPRIALCSPGAYVLGQHTNSVARDVHARPTPTVATGGKIHLVEPESFCLRQQSGGVPASVADPLPTVAGGGAIALSMIAGRPLVMPKNHRYRGLHSNGLYPPETRPFHTVTTDPRAKLIEPYLCPMYNPRPGQRPRTRPLDRPLMTVPASKSPAGLASPFLVEYYGQSEACPVDLPIPTVTTRDRFALCVPEVGPIGLDVKYRMLKPSELKQAQGFPADYDLAGERKRDVTEQIGNAVPVNTAKALCKHLLDVDDPSLSTYGGGLADDPDYEPPSYAEVAQSDD